MFLLAHDVHHVACFVHRKTRKHEINKSTTWEVAQERPASCLAHTHRNVAFANEILRHEPSVAEGCQEETGVGDHQHHRVGGASARFRACHPGLDRQCEEIGEEDQETPLLSGIDTTLEARR